MTPAVNQAKKAKVPYVLHEYEHDPAAESFGEEVVQKLGVAPERGFKTLVIALGEKTLAVAVVPVLKKLDLKKVAQAFGVKKTEMADPKVAERVTGYVVGGISPLGQKKRLPTVIDDSAQASETIFVSAGRRGLTLELAPDDLASLTQATFHPVARD